ncbi:MAG: hypothetical protein ACM3WV_00250 [Bacillota bacterium]
MPLTEKDRKVLIFGGITALCLILVGLIYLPTVRNWDDAKQALQAELKEYETFVRLRPLAAPSYQKEIKQISRRLQERFFMRESQEEVSLKLLEILEESGYAEEIVWNKEEILPVKTSPGTYPVIMAHVNGTCQPDQLARLIERLENNKKFLWIDQLSYEKDRENSYSVGLTLATILPRKTPDKEKGRIN